MFCQTSLQIEYWYINTDTLVNAIIQQGRDVSASFEGFFMGLGR